MGSSDGLPAITAGPGSCAPEAQPARSAHNTEPSVGATAQGDGPAVAGTRIALGAVRSGGGGNLFSLELRPPLDMRLPSLSTMPPPVRPLEG